MLVKLARKQRMLEGMLATAGECFLSLGKMASGANRKAGDAVDVLGPKCMRGRLGCNKTRQQYTLWVALAHQAQGHTAQLDLRRRTWQAHLANFADFGALSVLLFVHVLHLARLPSTPRPT